jgi:D-beta-D-heptose 7-phosphate kinase/D-beta-D-heptose 1-phosphate adenosyltransferase
MIEQNIQQQKSFKILLIGDDCVDVYQLGTADRSSPEAPVMVFCPEEQYSLPGMAGNVKANLEALGCDVDYLHGNTSIKTRLVDSKSGYQLIRIDQDNTSAPLELDTAIPEIYNAVVISDYNKGTVSYDLIEEIRSTFKGPIFIDTKKTDLKRLEGCVVKVNDLEYSKITSSCTDLVITHGKNGVSYLGYNIPAIPVEVNDVVGAGDTFLAAMTYQYLKTNSMNSALEFATKASAITVQHRGVYAPTLKEIE